MLERDASGRNRRVEPTFPRRPSYQTESSEGSYCFCQREVYASLGETLFLITIELSCRCSRWQCHRDIWNLQYFPFNVCSKTRRWGKEWMILISSSAKLWQDKDKDKTFQRSQLEETVASTKHPGSTSLIRSRVVWFGRRFLGSSLLSFNTVSSSQSAFTRT